MTDALRSDRPAADEPDRERDARIEDLLLAGLDHYFAARYDLAINVWTRVLFLDRSHAAARAYIERARGALAERQREGDELLHTGVAALDRGDREAARRLLTSAVDRGTSGEEALVLLERLARLEAASWQGAARRPPQGPSAGRPPAVERRRRDLRLAPVAVGLVAGILLAAVAGGYLWMVADPYEVGSARALPTSADEPLPVLAPCEIRLLRARGLHAQGLLREALAALAPGDPDERHLAAYDRLRADIQRQLLAAARQGGVPARAGDGASPAPGPSPVP